MLFLLEKILSKDFDLTDRDEEWKIKLFPNWTIQNQSPQQIKLINKLSLLAFHRTEDNKFLPNITNWNKKIIIILETPILKMKNYEGSVEIGYLNHEITNDKVELRGLDSNLTNLTIKMSVDRPYRTFNIEHFQLNNDEEYFVGLAPHLDYDLSKNYFLVGTRYKVAEYHLIDIDYNITLNLTLNNKLINLKFSKYSRLNNTIESNENDIIPIINKQTYADNYGLLIIPEKAPYRPNVNITLIDPYMPLDYYSLKKDHNIIPNLTVTCNDEIIFDKSCRTGYFDSLIADVHLINGIVKARKFNDSHVKLMEPNQTAIHSFELMIIINNINNSFWNLNETLIDEKNMEALKILKEDEIDIIEQMKELTSIDYQISYLNKTNLITIPFNSSIDIEELEIKIRANSSDSGVSNAVETSNNNDDFNEMANQIGVIVIGAVVVVTFLVVIIVIILRKKK